MRATVANVTPDVSIVLEQLLWTLVKFVALLSTGFAPGLAVAAKMLINNELQLFRVVRLH
jgi:hypothetical protein